MSIRDGELFTTASGPERMPVEFRPVRGSQSLLNSSVDRSESWKGMTTMVDPEGKDPGDAGLVFAAYNQHDPRCGQPPRHRNTVNPGLYYGYFENRYGEQFVFTFDRATGTGTVWGGDLDWAEPKSFTIGLLDEALRSTQRLAAQVVALGRTEESDLPVIDAALALGRLTGLTGKDEVIWLRACLAACTAFVGRPEGRQSD
jgi:hypothetical protein